MITTDDIRSKVYIIRGQQGGRRYLPYAFTEQGIYMLATVLRGELAEQQSIFIMCTFRKMRHYIKQNQQVVTRAEIIIWILREKCVSPFPCTVGLE